MKFRVACNICGLKIAKFKCNVCGRLVCEDCYVKDLGVCINCRKGKRM